MFPLARYLEGRVDHCADQSTRMEQKGLEDQEIEISLVPSYISAKLLVRQSSRDFVPSVFSVEKTVFLLTVGRDRDPVYRRPKIISQKLVIIIPKYSPFADEHIEMTLAFDRTSWLSKDPSSILVLLIARPALLPKGSFLMMQIANPGSVPSLKDVPNRDAPSTEL